MEYNSKLITNRNIENNKNNIDYRYKIVYAIAMISVIAEHCRGRGSIELNIQDWFKYSSYHMPLFMFAAGYFYKSKYVNQTFSYIFKKFKKLIIPIYLYNFFYGFYIQALKKLGFRNNIRPFSFSIIFIEPLGGCGFKHITPSWFSSSLFYVEVYNILKRKSITFLRLEIHESIYFIIDLIISYISILLSNKGYNKITLYMHILRFSHLNIYYELGIYFNKHLEKKAKSIRSDIYFINIFILKLLFHLYYSNAPSFYYGMCIYDNYSPFTVITISILGIAFWIRLCEILDPILGKNYYVNVIADNTFSIMINHSLALDIIRTIFAVISKYTKFCQNFDFNRYYSMEMAYIYIPNNVAQSGIIYFLGCLIIPIIMQKLINKIKKNFFNYIKLKY